MTSNPKIKKLIQKMQSLIGLCFVSASKMPTPKAVRKAVDAVVNSSNSQTSSSQKPDNPSQKPDNPSQITVTGSSVRKWSNTM